MSDIKIIEKNFWTKNWSGNWGLLFGSLYGDIYTKGIKDLTGKSFKHNLIIFEKGVSSNYLVKNELYDFCSWLVSLIKKDGTLTKRWSTQVIKNTDNIFSLMKKLDKQKNFVRKDYYDLEKARLSVTTANFSIKKVIDYLPDEIAQKNLPLFSRVRVYTEPVYNETDRLLTKIARFLLKDKVSAGAIQVLTKEDLETYFENCKIPKPAMIEKRLNGCALLYNDKGVCSLFQGKQFKNIMSSIIYKTNDKQIKGTVAYKGVAKGRVKVVLDPKKCTNFKKGDVLVAGMTRPEYLALMKKSSAFITDAGGLLCHAAIVAREMKKPCIVGTEIATKILKDNDLVEIDANKGIIKKL